MFCPVCSNMIGSRKDGNCPEIMIYRLIEDAMKRDILMYYLTDLMKNGFTPVLFDSEEIVTEDPVSDESNNDVFNDLIACQPEWMKESSWQPIMCLSRQWSKRS